MLATTANPNQKQHATTTHKSPFSTVKLASSPNYCIKPFEERFLHTWDAHDRHENAIMVKHADQHVFWRPSYCCKARIRTCLSMTRQMHQHHASTPVTELECRIHHHSASKNSVSATTPWCWTTPRHHTIHGTCEPELNLQKCCAWKIPNRTFKWNGIQQAHLKTFNIGTVAHISHIWIAHTRNKCATVACKRTTRRQHSFEMNPRIWQTKNAHLTSEQSRMANSNRSKWLETRKHAKTCSGQRTKTSNCKFDRNYIWHT